MITCLVLHFGHSTVAWVGFIESECWERTFSIASP